MNQQAEQHESDQQELVKQRMGYHGIVPFSRQEKETILSHSQALELSVGTRYRTGRKPEHIVASVQDYRTSCGERGWEGVANIQKVLAIGRQVGVPIIYTTGTPRSRRGTSWADRARGTARQGVLTPAELEHQHIGNTIVEEIGPQPEDLVIPKRGASGFFGTSLIRDLNELDIDTVLVTGTTTSGCVRATAVDAACYSFYVGVVEECCFDRFQISHKVSLMDIHAKYGMVMSLHETTEYLQTQAQPTPTVRKAP